MIVMHESAAAYKKTKTVICPKCNRGKLGRIPEQSDAVLSKRGKIPRSGFLFAWKIIAVYAEH